MSYNPQLKLYYLKDGESENENNRLVPAPQITISPEYYYANDIIIGYTHNITLNGYATALDLRSYSGQTVGFSGTIEAIQTIKNIFNGNNGSLVARDDNNLLLFVASGTHIKSINFEQSNNNWVNYSEYSVELEANEVQLSDCAGSNSPVSCGSIASGIIDSPYLIDMKNYKVKSFSDNWTFDINDTIYNSYNFDNTNDGKFNNEHFNITYTINATGKHYFKDNKLIPAWEQAKNFCQYRLHDQVSKLINQVLSISLTDSGCVTLGSLSEIFGSGNNYLLEQLTDANYKLFNEKISCTTSEAEGSFELTYTSILKRTASNNTYTDINTIHTFNTSRDVQDDGKTKNITITVDGNIQGLLPGGLITSSGVLSLPNNGQILLTVALNSGVDRYSKALSTYNRIVSNNTLDSNFANKLGITNTALGATGECLEESGTPPQSSHSSTHNYNEGIITYRTSYDTNRACSANNGSYSNISIVFQDTIPTIQEFIIPGRSGGPIIQDIKIDQPKKITINIDGAVANNNCCPNLEDILSSGCDGIPTFSGIPGAEIGNMKLTENRYNKSSDGSYSITRSYIYYDL
jgi:hypothetical protein